METPNTQIGWLRGIKILLLGHYVPAPLAAYFLHNLGAEVIKVEDGRGDPLRKIGSFGPATAGQTSPMFWALNAGFKSLGLQYRRPEGAELLRKLIGKVDVVIDGSRAGALERILGASMAEVAPQVIYVPISAYGLVGPMAALAGHDNNILAMAGNLSYTQQDAEGRPTVFSAPVADLFAGQMAAMGALAALIGRQNPPHTAQGPITIDASMLHAGFFLNFLELASRNDPNYQTPQASRAWMNGGRPDYKTYRCNDGRYVFFGLIEPWAATRFFGELGREDLAAYLEAPHLLEPELLTLFAQRSQAEWVRIGVRHDACITPVNDLEEAVKDAQIQALGRIQTVQTEDLGPIEVPSFPLGIGPQSLPLKSTAQSPGLGQHNDDLLTGLLDMWPSEIHALYEKEILIRGTKAPRKE